MPEPTDKKQPHEVKPLVGLATAPEIFVDGYSGVSVSNGVVKLNFFTEAFEPFSDKSERVVAVRMACSLVTLGSIRAGLDELFRMLEKQGVVVEVKTQNERATQN